MAEVKILTRAEILAADDIPRELVEVPEWGGSVYVRGLTAMERSEFENLMLGLENRRIKVGKSDDMTIQMDMRVLRVRLSALCMVDEKGNRLFGDDEVEALGRKSADALNRIFVVAQRLSGMTSDDVEDAAGN